MTNPRVPFQMTSERKPLKPPKKGKNLIVHVVVNVEYWPFDQPMPRKTLKKALKHLVFFGLSFIIGNTLLAYLIGSEQLLAIQFDDPRNHLGGLTFMVLFTLLFYSIFARFREQACTFICPYGRLQSTMLDENSLVSGTGRILIPGDLDMFTARLDEGLHACVEDSTRFSARAILVSPPGVTLSDAAEAGD